MIRGWCPSLHEPMASGDGLLLRVKPPLGRLSAEAGAVLADAAVRDGNGAIELTGRGALQFRGFDAASAVRFAATAVELGLAAPGAAERRRSVLVSPLAGLDPAVAPETEAVARALEAALLNAEDLAALPAKWGFAVDGGGALPLGASEDVGLHLVDGRCWLVPGGAEFAGAVPIGTAVEAALALSRAFLRMGEGARRMRGVDPVRVLEVAGLVPRPFRAAAARQAVGPVPGGVAAGLPFGAMDAALLRRLGAVRLTPWRSVVLPGRSATPAGTIGAGDDPRLRVFACPGAPGCASASVVTRAWAARLRPAPGMTIHVSGCEKGCAHPSPATLTYVGRDGRFDLVRGGRAGDTGTR